MSRGLNKVMIIGNLGADPEVRYMPSGSAVTNIRVATSEGWKDKQTGEVQERTEWHRIVLYNRLAEVAGEYLKKGSKVYIEGSIRTSKWQDQSGADRYTTEIVANNMQMLDSRGGGAAVAFDMPADGAEMRSMPKSGTTTSGAQQNSNTEMVAEFDDEIPF